MDASKTPAAETLDSVIDAYRTAVELAYNAAGNGNREHVNTHLAAAWDAWRQLSSRGHRFPEPPMLGRVTGDF